MILRRLRAWVRGEGPVSIIDVVVVVLFLAVAITALGLAVGFHREAAATRQQLTELRATIYGRCLQRQTYDESNHASVVADVDLYKQILELQQLSPTPPDPKLRALSMRYRDAVVQAQTRKEKAAAQGVIGSCTAYRP